MAVMMESSVVNSCLARHARTEIVALRIPEGASDSATSDLAQPPKNRLKAAYASRKSAPIMIMAVRHELTPTSLLLGSDTTCRLTNRA